MKIRLCKASESAIGAESPTGMTDVINRPLIDVFVASGLDITAEFEGFAKKNHTHTPNEIFGGLVDIDVRFGKPVTIDDQLVSTLANGTKPLDITSRTLVDNLNADLLDGKEAASFADKATTLAGYGITDAYTKTEVDDAIANNDSGGVTTLPYPDNPPTSPSPYDDEFNVSVLDPKWTILTNLAAPNTYDINTTVPGWIIGKFSSVTGPTLELEQTVSGFPAGTTFSITAKVSGSPIANYGGIVVRAKDTAIGNNSIYIALQFANTYTVNYGKRASGVDTFTIGQKAWTDSGTYLHMQREATNTWLFFCSTDGITWFSIKPDIVLAFDITKLYLSISGPNSANKSRSGIDWFRVNWLTL